MQMGHHHHHDHDVKSTLSFDEKMIKLLEHWIRHNEDHARTYTEWAQKAKDKNRNEAARLLEDAAEMTLQLGKKFEMAMKQMNQDD